MGAPVSETDPYVRRTNMYNLGTILYHGLRESPLWTKDCRKADVVFVNYDVGVERCVIAFLCMKERWMWASLKRLLTRNSGLWRAATLTSDLVTGTGYGPLTKMMRSTARAASYTICWTALLAKSIYRCWVRSPTSCHYQRLNGTSRTATLLQQKGMFMLYLTRASNFVCDTALAVMCHVHGKAQANIMPVQYGIACG